MVRTVLLTILALYVAYLVVINVFLSTSLFERFANAKPWLIDIHFSRAWSVLPGRIHARDLRIRGADSYVEWYLQIGDIDFDVSGLALLRTRFEVSRVRGRDVSFRLRQRLPAPTGKLADYVDLPPIPGFGPYGVLPPPMFDAGDWDDRYYHLWTVSLANVRAENVREVWIDNQRFVGHADISGGFFLKPLRIVEVGPLDIAIASGTIGPSVQALAGTMRATIARFDPRITLLRGVFRRVSATTALRFSVTTPHVVADVPRLALVLDRGHLEAGSHVDLAAAVRTPSLRGVVGLVLDVGERVGVRATVEDFVAEGLAVRRAKIVASTAEKDLTVEDLPRFLVRAQGHAGFHEKSTRAEADVELRADLDPGQRRLLVHDADMTMSEASGRLGSVRWSAKRVRASGRTPRFDPSKPTLRGADLHLEIDGGQADLAGLGAVSPELSIDRGSARIGAKVDLLSSQPAKSGGNIDVSLIGASIRWKKGRYAGDITAETKVHGYIPGKGTLDLSGSSIGFSNFFVGNAPLDTKSWQGTFDLRSAYLSLRASPELEAEVGLRANDASPFVAAAFAGNIPGILAGLVRMPNLRASALVHLGHDSTQVDNVKAQGGDVTVEGFMRMEGAHTGGRFDVKKGVIIVGVVIDDAGVHAKPLKRVR